MNYFHLIVLFSCLVAISMTSSLRFNINSSLLLNANSGISTINKDLQGNFLVAFLNGEARKYTDNFNSYVALNMSKVVDLFVARKTTITGNLSNGTYISMNEKQIATLSNNFTTLLVYNYYSYALEETYFFDQFVLSQAGHSLTVYNVSNSLNTLISNESIIIAYRGMVTSLLNFSSIFGSGATCLDAISYNSPLTSNQDNIFANFVFYISLSDNNVYQMNITLLLTFNYSIALYDLQNTSYSYQSIYASHQAIDSLFISSAFLMMQADQTLVTTIYSLNYSTISTLPGLSYSQTYNFFNYSSDDDEDNHDLYVMQQTSITKLYYNYSTGSLVVGSTIISLPTNHYGTILGKDISALFVYGSNSIYLNSDSNYNNTNNTTNGTNNSTNITNSNNVTNSSSNSNNSNIQLICQVSNCSNCSVYINACNICDIGFILNNQSLCVLINGT